MNGKCFRAAPPRLGALDAAAYAANKAWINAPLRATLLQAAAHAAAARSKESADAH